MESFRRRDIPPENIIGFESDGCNVLMGKNNSVASRFRETCPGIIILKCICHSAHICASEACKELPRICEDLAINVFTFLHRSAKRQCTLGQFQTFLDIKPHKILHSSQTRWLLLEAVVKRILEQWSALKLYFNDTYLSQKLPATEQIYHGLNDPIVKLYFNFLAWILPKFTDFNKDFQTENVVITNLHDKMCTIYSDILLTFMRTDLSKIEPVNGQYHLPQTQMYLGIKVHQLINTPIFKDKTQELAHFFDRCRKFLIKSAEEIRKRYNMSDPILSKLTILNANNTLSSTFREHNPSLMPLISVVPRIINDDDILQKIDDQWKTLPLTTPPDNITALQYFNESPDLLW